MRSYLLLPYHSFLEQAAAGSLKRGPNRVLHGAEVHTHVSCVSFWGKHILKTHVSSSDLLLAWLPMFPVNHTTRAVTGPSERPKIMW